MNAPRLVPAARQLSELVAGFAPVKIPAARVMGVESDSRRVRAGDLFLAARGGTRHGLEFLPQALARGASAIAWEPDTGVKAPTARVPTVAVESLNTHVGEIASRFYGNPSQALFCVGVTGTDGKTSCAHIIAQALRAAGHPCGYLGTLGYGFPDDLREASHTTPDPVSLQRWLAALLLRGAEATVMEVSSHALTQGRTAGVAFDVAILTNLGRDHLDYHRTPQAYVAAKKRLFESPGPDTVILNADDPMGRQWIAEMSTNRRVVSYGLDPQGADDSHHVLGKDLQLGLDGIRLVVAAAGAATPVQSPLLGRFNAYNLLAAFAALLAYGLSPAQTGTALAAAGTVPGRMEGFRAATGGPLAVVDYSHTPGALAVALDALRAHTAGRLWCVFGCGGDRDRGKRPLMARAVAERADRAIITDDNPRGEDPDAIVTEMLRGWPDRKAFVVERDRALAIRTAIESAEDGDVVLIAGKGHERAQIVGQEQRPFSDRDCVASILGLESRS